MAASPLTSWVKQHTAAEKRLAKVLQTFFSEQTKRLVEKMSDYESPTPAIVPAIFVPSDERALLLAAVAEPLLTFMATGAETVIAATPAKPAGTKAAESSGLEDFELPQRVKDSILSVYGELEEQSYWQDIQDATAEKLTGLLASSIEEGLSGPAIAKNLRELFTELGKVRSRAIARTETTLAFNAGHQASYDALADDGDIDGKKWLALVDGDVREAHAALDGEQVAAGDDFDVGGTSAPYPGHWSLPAKQRVNCRCTTVAVFN